MAKRLMTTPRGRAIWPHLHAPDTKFDAAGVYSTKLNLSASAARPLIEALEEMQKQAADEAVKSGEFKPRKRGETVKLGDLPFVEEEDGSFTFNFKLKASGKTRDGREFKQSPTIFDAFGKAVPGGLKVGGGSTIRVSFEPSGFYTALVGASVTLRLKAVQVIDLVDFGGGSADYYGFEPEEDGFSAGEAPENAFSNESSEDELDQDDDDDLDGDF